MKTSILYAAALVAASFVFAPVASADPITVGPATVNADSYTYGSGDCDGGQPYYVSGNYANVVVRDGATTHVVYAQTWCYDQNSPWGQYEGSGVSAGYYSFNSQTWAYSTVYANWYSWSYNGNGYCYTNVGYRNIGGGSDNEQLGCPAGAPPELPALLP